MNHLNRINFIYYYQLKKINVFNTLSVSVTEKKLKKASSKKRLKKQILFKVVKLQLEKILFKLLKFNTILDIKNVFTLFKVKSNLKVPKNAVI